MAAHPDLQPNFSLELVDELGELGSAINDTVFQKQDDYEGREERKEGIKWIPVHCIFVFLASFVVPFLLSDCFCEMV